MEGAGVAGGGGVTQATPYLHVRVRGLDVLDHLLLVARVALRRVDDDDVDARLDEHGDARLVLGPRVDGGADEEALGRACRTCRGRGGATAGGGAEAGERRGWRREGGGGRVGRAEREALGRPGEGSKRRRGRRQKE